MLFIPHEKGQGLVEYALVILLVGIVVVVLVTVLGPGIGNMYSSVIELM